MLSDDQENRRIFAREKSSRYYHKNREKALAQQRLYAAAHKEEKRVYDATYRADHREEKLEKDHAYLSKNREAINKRRRSSRAANPKPFREKDRLYNITNHDKKLEKDRLYREENREKLRIAYRLFHEEHKEERNAKASLRHAENPEPKRFAASLRKKRIKNATINDLTLAQWKEIKAAYGHRCMYCPPTCWRCRDKKHKLTMDHIIPLSKGGNHTASNIVPACHSCNSKKYTGPPPQPVQPLLLTIASSKKPRGPA